ncbi:cysteinyl leukotriene receptor 2-like [Lissotriton helveticus]
MGLIASGMANNSSFHYCDSEDFKIPIYTTCYVVTFIIGFTSNIVALYVFLRILPSKAPSSIFMTNLAISDMLFTLTLPLRIDYYQRKEGWIFGDPMCGISIYAFYVNMYTSILFLTAVSISRYVAVVHPMKARRVFNCRRCVVISIAIWALVSFLTSPFLVSRSYSVNETIKCFEPRNPTYLGRVLIMNYSGLVIGFLLPFIAITVCYICIIHKLRGVTKELGENGPRRRRSVALVSVVLTVFLFCFFPYHVVRTVHLHFASTYQSDCTVTTRLQKIVVLSLCMAASNSCFNPLLYYFAGTSFRRALKKSFRNSRSVSFRKSVPHSMLEATPNVENSLFVCEDQTAAVQK